MGRTDTNAAARAEDDEEEEADVPREVRAGDHHRDGDDEEARLNAAVGELAASRPIRDLVAEVVAVLQWETGVRSANAPEGVRTCWRFIYRRCTFLRISYPNFRQPTLVPLKTFNASYIHVPTTLLRRLFADEHNNALRQGLNEDEIEVYLWQLYVSLRRVPQSESRG